MSGEQIQQAAAGTAYHLPRVSLLCWENTHNVSGGTVVPLDTMQAGSAVARSLGLAIHLDGARLWNAVAASGVDAAAYAECADSVMFCFSKGLGAPVGSVVVGSGDFISQARRTRARLGGAMRQVGVVAAAARVALEDRGRVVDDHSVARRLADGLAVRFPDAVDAGSVATNMVLVHESGLPWSADVLVAALEADGIRTALITPGVLRFCTHHNVDAADIDRVLATIDAMDR
jgi:threonine aldolase